MSKEIKNLNDLGYNSFFESRVRGIDSKHCFPARVIAAHKELYRVKNVQGEFFAKITGKQIFEATSREDYPAVGDWVLVTEPDGGHAVIEKTLPRQTIIKRRFGDRNKSGEKSAVQIIATNVDVGFVIESTDRDYSLNRFERYFAMLEYGGVRGVIVINKIDLLSEPEKKRTLHELQERFPHTDSIVTSTVNDNGLDALKEYIEKGKTYCFLGSSGVGKSSLINKLIGEDVIKTGGISSYADRGKHTTTGRQMYFLDTGGIVIDNPGMREVGVADDGEGLDTCFEEIALLGQGCTYVDCTHTHEPGCVVVEAVNSGKIDKEKYSNYMNLKKEAEYYSMSDSQKRQKSKHFGKFVHKAKKELKDAGYDGYQ